MKRRYTAVLLCLLFAVIGMAILCLFVGSSHMSVGDCISALFGKGKDADIRIVRNIRLPRVLAALIAGAGLSVSGLIMQTTLGNPMASPATLGVSGAAVFGANLSIIVFSGGVSAVSHNPLNFGAGADPYSTGSVAFVFAVLSVLAILGLCRLRSFSPVTVVLAGIAMGSVWTAATTVLQYYATDVGLSAAVIWSFGDLGRATYRADAIMLVAVAAALTVFWCLSWRYNAMLSGDEAAVSLGIRVKTLRFVSLLLSSLVTAVCVSYLGIISFVGIICPHIVRRILGCDHRAVIPASALCGSLLLLCADALSRTVGNGSALPVGAVTSLLGAPFFLFVILKIGGNDRA